MSIQVLVGCADPQLVEAVHAMLDAKRFPHSGVRHVLARPSGLSSALARSRPDVLLLEHDLPGSGLRQVQALLTQLDLGTRTLLVLRAADKTVQLQMLRDGASGALLGSELGSMGVKAIHAVHGGQLWFSRALMRQAVSTLVWSVPGRVVYTLSDEEGLTPREGEILRLIGSGLTNKEIARRLQISDYTVKTHLHRVYVKLHRSGRYKAFLAHAALPRGMNALSGSTGAD